ncbi:hypothetical protein N7493_011590 [Penicillium malachiteum]|uniref:Uncharacterized protein n=1 Tax=Penicillium malachiteum TaxID=1324776 RepID=A0AAD6HAZ4_9EURO|nr:hypothetical protein N7493_011590 [Penicillium malachiteum]
MSSASCTLKISQPGGILGQEKGTWMVALTRVVLSLGAFEAFVAETAMKRAVHTNTTGEFIGLVMLWTAAQSALLLAPREQL